MTRMHWKNTKTGEKGSWPWTGQDAESMAREAQCYSGSIPEMEYTMVEIRAEEAEEETNPTSR